MKRFLKSRLLWTVRVVAESVMLLGVVFLTIMFCLVVAGCERRDLDVPDTLQATGLYRVTCQPEEMGLDTLRNMTVYLVMKMNR